MALMKETTSRTWEKLAEIETSDFSDESIYNLLCKEFGEPFFDLEEIDHAKRSGFIEICDDGFILWMQ